MLKYKDLDYNDEVKWTDPETKETNVYKVVSKYSDVGKESIIVISDGFTETEVFLAELE